MSQPYRNPRGLCAAAILACLSATAGAAPIPISSLVDDFDINVNSTNSTWSYGTVVPASNPFVMKLLDTKTKTMSGIFSSDTALPVWGSTDYSWAYWMLGKNTGASAIHNIWGDTLDFQPGTVMLYPGQDSRNLLVSWLAPSDMVINANWTFTRISARKSGSPYPAGQGTDYRVTHRSGAVDTTVVGFAGVARPGGTLYASHTNSFTGLSVKAGDRVFWEIAGFNNTVDVDATDAAITITAAPSLASHAIVDDHGGGPVATGTLVTYTVTFSHDMDASTISADDFGNAGTAGVSIGTVTETAPTSGVFTVPVTPTTTGILQLQVNAGAILNDADGIPLNTTSAIADDTTLTVATPGDTTPPTLTSIADDKSGGPAERNALVTYTVTFDEAMDPSTISAADFSNAGTAAVTIDTATQTAPAVFSVPVTPTTTGTLQLQVNAGAELKDLAANALVTTSAIPDDTTLAVNDTIPPTLTSIVDDKSGATIAPNTLVTYTVTFSEGMDAGTVSDADFGNAGTAAVTIGTVTETTPGVFTVQATPTSGGTLQLQVNAGAELKDIAGNALVTTSAILDDTTITVDGTPPTIATLSPADDATGVTLCANLEVTFSEAIAIGTGNLTIKNLSDNTQSTIDITSGSPQVSVSGSQLRITPAADLAMLRSYAIQIDASAIMDLYGNFFAGIADDTTWNFTTATSWSLANDFNIHVNSMSSTWSYGTVVPASNPFVMKLLDTKTKTMSGIFSSDTALPVWGSTDYSWAYWMLGKNTGASAIHNIWGDTLDFQPGTVMLYPGQDSRNLLVSWLAPSDMVINANWTFTRISARKSGSPYPAGQGTDYRVTHRSGAVDTTVVGFAGGARPGGTLYDSHGSSFAGLSVKAGDRVFWEIAGVGGTVDVDATGADITITSASPYASWAGGNGFDSLNSEGVAYGMAWVLGASTNASSSIGLLPESSNDSGKLVLTFDCLSAAGRGTAALTVQYSKDLGQADLWTNHEAAVPGAAGSSDVGSVHFEAAMIGDLIHVVATIPASEASTDGKLFARLMATE